MYLQTCQDNVYFWLPSWPLTPVVARVVSQLPKSKLGRPLIDDHAQCTGEGDRHQQREQDPGLQWSLLFKEGSHANTYTHMQRRTSAEQLLVWPTNPRNVHKQSHLQNFDSRACVYFGWLEWCEHNKRHNLFLCLF